MWTPDEIGFALRSVGAVFKPLVQFAPSCRSHMTEAERKTLDSDPSWTDESGGSLFGELVEADVLCGIRRSRIEHPYPSWDHPDVFVAVVGHLGVGRMKGQAVLQSESVRVEYR